MSVLHSGVPHFGGASMQQAGACMWSGVHCVCVCDGMNSFEALNVIVP